jgi:hypothetical protein
MPRPRIVLHETGAWTITAGILGCMSAGAPRSGEGPITFFIAYAAPDAAVAERLYNLLATESTVFLDTRSLRLGDDWDRELAAAQRRAAITVVLVSDHTEEGFYQREEIARAIEMARQGSHRVVPLWLSGTGRRHDVPGRNGLLVVTTRDAHISTWGSQARIQLTGEGVAVHSCELRRPGQACRVCAIRAPAATAAFLSARPFRPHAGN